MPFVFFLFVIILIGVIANIKIVPQAHAFIIERLGGYSETWNVGLHIKIPFIDRIAKKVNLKEQVFRRSPLSPRITSRCKSTQSYTSRFLTRSFIPMALNAR